MHGWIGRIAIYEQISQEEWCAFVRRHGVMWISSAIPAKGWGLGVIAGFVLVLAGLIGCYIDDVRDGSRPAKDKVKKRDGSEISK